jgi:hypothetical protein
MPVMIVAAPSELLVQGGILYSFPSTSRRAKKEKGQHK